MRLKGKGGYSASDLFNDVTTPFRDNVSTGFVNNVARGIGQTVGDLLPIPGAGRALGNAGSWLARLVGLGKYDEVNINTNKLTSNKLMGLKAPTFGSVGKESDISFTHSEYIQDVVSSEAFALETFAINGGNDKMFNWASRIAELYEEYTLEGCVFEYRSMCGTSNTAAVPGFGTVIMATEYDCYDPGYPSKRAMETAEFSNNGTPYERIFHAIECDPKRNVLRSNFVVPGLHNASDALGDERMSVLGNFSIATQGQQAAGVVMGELWVHYKMRLSRPILEPEDPSSLWAYHFSGELNIFPALVGDPTIVYTNSPPVTISIGTSTGSFAQFALYNGTYIGRVMVSVLSYNASASGWNGVLPIVYNEGASSPNLWYGDAYGWNPSITNGISIGTTSLIVDFAIQNTSVVNGLFWNSDNITTFDIIVTPMTNELVNDRRARRRRRRGEYDNYQTQLSKLNKQVQDLSKSTKQPINVCTNPNSNSSKIIIPKITAGVIKATVDNIDDSVLKQIKRNETTDTVKPVVEIEHSPIENDYDKCDSPKTSLLPDEPITETMIVKAIESKDRNAVMKLFTKQHQQFIENRTK